LALIRVSAHAPVHEEDVSGLIDEMLNDMRWQNDIMGLGDNIHCNRSGFIQRSERYVVLWQVDHIILVEEGVDDQFPEEGDLRESGHKKSLIERTLYQRGRDVRPTSHCRSLRFSSPATSS
jgi:hypothetical protein